MANPQGTAHLRVNLAKFGQALVSNRKKTVKYEEPSTQSRWTEETAAQAHKAINR